MSRATDYIGILELIYLPNMLMRLKPEMKVVTLTMILVLYGYLASVDMREQSKLLKNTSGLNYPIVMIWQSDDVNAIMEGNYD